MKYVFLGVVAAIWAMAVCKLSQVKKHRGRPSLPAGRRLFEEGWIGGTGRLRRPSKPADRGDSLGARTAEGFFKWERDIEFIMGSLKTLAKTKVLTFFGSRVSFVHNRQFYGHSFYVSANISINCAFGQSTQHDVTRTLWR